MQNHTGCNCLISLDCVFSNVSSKFLHRWMHNYTGCICLIFLQYVFFLLPMSLQTACPRGCVITLFTFVWLFSTVFFFQMSTQIAGVSCCIITLVTVVPRLRSIWGKIWPCWRFHFSPRCVFRCLLEWPAQVDAYSHWLHLFDLSPVCVFKCVLNALGSEQV